MDDCDNIQRGLPFVGESDGSGVGRLVGITVVRKVGPTVRTKEC